MSMLFLGGVKCWRCLQVAIAAMLCQFTMQTHFRGGQLWFTPVPEEGRYVMDIHFRLGWRRSSSGSTYCDQSTIDSGVLIGPVTAGSIVCDVGMCAGEEITKMDFKCTDFSVVEDWTVGVHHHRYTFPAAGEYQLLFKGKGWLDGVIHAHDAEWELRMFMNLSPRPDNGQTNSSPRSAVSPIVRMQANCENVLQIPVSDDDGDIVRCRKAEQWPGECGGICDAFEYDNAYIDKDLCVIRYNARDELGSYAVAIQLEDFVDKEANEPLSSVPVQFIIYVYGSDQDCDQAPQFIDPTPEGDSCVTFDVDTEYTSKIVARTKDQFTAIEEITTISSVGMKKSPIHHYQDDPRDYYVDVTWTPRDVGERIFCFSAEDSNKISTEQRCIYLVIGLEPVMANRVEAEEYEDHVMLSIYFNQRIQRPEEAHLISVFNEGAGELVLQVDAANDSEVFFENESVHLNTTMKMKTGLKYYILMPEGTVAATRRCGSDSQAVNSSSTLSFILPGALSTAPADAIVVITESSVTTEESGDQETASIVAPTPAAVTDSDDENFLWLILIVVGVILVVTLVAILVGFLLARKKYRRDKRSFSEETGGEKFMRHLKTKGVYNNSYQT